MTDPHGSLDGDAWYTWEEATSEEGWLLSYVDVLSVILAMLLVLLVTSLQPEPPLPDAGEAPEPSIASEVPPATKPAVPVETPAFSPVERPIEAPAQSTVPETSRSLVMQHAPLSTALPPPLPALPQIPGETMARPNPADTTMDIDGVEVLRDDGGLTLQIAEVVLFDSSQAELKAGAGPVLERAILLLRAFGNTEVAVQGHTDNRPVQGGHYRSNWELAAARASAVATFLMAQGFPPDRLRLESYADTRPIADNDTDEGRARNRRVVLRVEMDELTVASATR